jgi:hypothetical protein
MSGSCEVYSNKKMDFFKYISLKKITWTIHLLFFHACLFGATASFSNIEIVGDTNNLAPKKTSAMGGPVVQPPFSCDGRAYLLQNNPSDIYRINLVTGTQTLLVNNFVPLPHTFRLINGVGYDINSNYMWGNVTSTDSIARIGSDWSVEYFRIPGLTNNVNTGDISASGVYYMYQNAANIIQRVDVNPSSPTYLQKLPNLSTSAILIADWAFSPIDGNLYTVQTGTARLIRFNPATGAQTLVSTLTGLPGGGAYGGVYFDAAGNFYVSENGSGTIYRILRPDLNTTTATLYSDGPASSLNDGVRCVTAPISIDFGDAPNSYKTTLASGGPFHETRVGLTLGSSVDAEIDGVPAAGAADANGDDLAGTDDENGITSFPSLGICNNSYTLTVNLINTTGGSATVIGWIDFDRDGIFQTDEGVSKTISNNTTSTTLTWNNLNSSGPNMLAGITYARFRLTTDATITTATVGEGAEDGEVEDYQLTISGPPTASISVNDNAQCLTGNSFVYTLSQTGGASYNWNFGSGASPSNASSIGPHTVTYSSVGTKTYSLTVTSAAGCTMTTTGTVTIHNDISITSQPSSATICSGTSQNFTVAGTGGGAALTYQWQYFNGTIWSNVVNGTPAGAIYSGATTTNLGISGNISGGIHPFRAMVNDVTTGCSATSGTANLTVIPNPMVVVSPPPSICIGGNSTLTADLAGNGSLTAADFDFQWQLSTDNTVWTNITGATAQTYIANYLSESTYFRVIVTRKVYLCSTTSASVQVVVLPQPNKPGLIGY